MTLNRADRDMLADSQRRINEMRAIAANMKHTVELSGAELRILRRALQRFTTINNYGIAHNEAVDAENLLERLSSVGSLDLCRV